MMRLTVGQKRFADLASQVPRTRRVGGGRVETQQCCVLDDTDHPEELDGDSHDQGQAGELADRIRVAFGNAQQRNTETDAVKVARS